MIAGLDSRVDVTFTEDARFIIVRTPYNRDFLTCYSWPYMWKEKLPDNTWKFKESDFDDVIGLLFDFFSVPASSQQVDREMPF